MMVPSQLLLLPPLTSTIKILFVTVVLACMVVTALYYQSNNYYSATIKSSSPPPIPTASPDFPYLSPTLEKITTQPDVFVDNHVPEFDEDGSPLKIILFWNEFVNNKHFGFGYGRRPFMEAGCKVNKCLTTGDRSRYPMSRVDAVLWHFRSVDRSLPQERYPHTRYIFFMMESASYLFGDLITYNGVFNWTFTYRRDSDIYNPYSKVYSRRHPLPPPTTPHNYAKGKTKLAAWFVSNCNSASGRDFLVKELQKWIKVDVYGNCGKLKCPRSKSDECYDMLSRDYKFYLSFENSLCLDYVTEKFFNVLRYDVVPVVLGKGNYTAIGPPHSFIDALSFSSAHSLADYLVYLDSNDTAYNEYFRWKRFYHQPYYWAGLSVPFCDLCEKLHRDEPPKTYNINKWFKEDSHCQSIRNPDIFKFIFR